MTTKTNMTNSIEQWQISGKRAPWQASSLTCKGSFPEIIGRKPGSERRSLELALLNAKRKERKASQLAGYYINDEGVFV